MFRPLALILLLLTPAAARAEWQVSTAIDRMTDRKETTVSLAAKDAAPVRLVVSCYRAVGSSPARLVPEVIFNRPFAIRKTGVEHRFDQDPPRLYFASVANDGRSVWVWLGEESAAVAKIRKAKRLRVSANSTFLDFDLTGADAAIKQVRCPP